MAKKRNLKDKEIGRLHDELLHVTTVVLSAFTGLTVEQETELRRQVQALGGRYRVVKNTLAARAAKGTPAESLLAGLKGVNSIAYTAGEPVALVRMLTHYAKGNPAFAFRAGLVEGRVVSLEQIRELAALPTREELFLRLLGLFQASAQRLATAVSAVGRNLTIVLKQAHDEKKFSDTGSPRGGGQLIDFFQQEEHNRHGGESREAGNTEGGEGGTRREQAGRARRADQGPDVARSRRARQAAGRDARGFGRGHGSHHGCHRSTRRRAAGGGKDRV